MLFLETLNKHKPSVEKAVKELFSAAKRNQTHEQDLLLVDINGFYEQVNFENRKYSPFLIGLGGWPHYSDWTQYHFFDTYRRLILKESKEDFFNDFTNNKDKKMF